MAYPPQPQPQQPGPWGGAPGQGAPQGYDPQSPTGPQPPTGAQHPAPPAQPGRPGLPRHGPSPYEPGPATGDAVPAQPGPAQPGYGQDGHAQGGHAQGGHGPADDGQAGYGPSPYAQGGPPYGPPPHHTGAADSGKKIAAVVFTLMGITAAAIVGLLIYFFISPENKIGKIALPTSRPSTAEPRPSEPARPSETAQPSETARPSETSTPSATKKRAEPGSPITADEFGDWNFKLGSAQFRANKVAGWTYDTCTPVDGKERVLRANGCERAVQLAYSAYNGHLKAVQLLLAFPDERSATSAAGRLAELSSNAVRWRQDQAHSDYVYGKILSGASGNYVVVTIVTADKTASKRAPDFHAYLQTDHKAYFSIRDVGFTS